MLQKNITIQKTARYFVLGEPSEKTEQVWIVCHGYAQLASYFIRNFAAIDDGKTLIVAPEGLNRFYWNGFSGRVVASWMTKEDRLSDIKDYVNFLDHVYIEVRSQFQHKIKISVLGFSQGASTVLRWINTNKPELDQLILWTGSIPPDVDLAADTAYFNSFKTVYVSASDDEFISKEDAGKQEAALRKEITNLESIRFEGKHEIHAPTLEELHRRP